MDGLMVAASFTDHQSINPSNPRGNPRRTALEKVFNDFCDALKLCIRQFGVDRQTEALASSFFGDREITRFMAKVRIGLLQMQRQRIMERAADVVGFKMLL